MFSGFKDQSDISHHIIFLIHDKDDAEKKNCEAQDLKNYGHVTTDIGRIHSASSIKNTIDQNKSQPNICQHPLRQEAMEGIKPLISAYINKEIIMPCTSPCNSPILSVKKPNGKGQRFIQDHPKIYWLAPNRTPWLKATYKQIQV